MNLLRAMLAMCLAAPLAACALSGGAIEGRVLEEGTNKPIPGAIVVVRWHGRVSAFVDSHGVCYHVEMATTDEQGRYQTKPWRQPREYMVSFDHIDADAYKPSYGRPRKLSQVMEIEYLAPFIGTREEGLKFLETFGGMQCGKAEDYAPKLIPLYKAIYEEARLLAVTKEEKKRAIALLRELDEMEFGYDKSWDNWRERMKEIQ